MKMKLWKIQVAVVALAVSGIYAGGLVGAQSISNDSAPVVVIVSGATETATATENPTAPVTETPTETATETAKATATVTATATPTEQASEDCPLASDINPNALAASAAMQNLGTPCDPVHGSDIDPDAIAVAVTGLPSTGTKANPGSSVSTKVILMASALILIGVAGATRKQTS